MKQGMYRQCTLANGRYRFKTAWIPVKFAKEGKLIKLRMDDGSWEDGWKVINAHTMLHANVVEVLEDQHRRSRKTTDV